MFLTFLNQLLQVWLVRTYFLSTENCLVLQNLKFWNLKQKKASVCIPGTIKIFLEVFILLRTGHSDELGAWFCCAHEVMRASGYKMGAINQKLFEAFLVLSSRLTSLNWAFMGFEWKVRLRITLIFLHLSALLRWHRFRHVKFWMLYALVST